MRRFPPLRIRGSNASGILGAAALAIAGARYSEWQRVGVPYFCDWNTRACQGSNDRKPLPSPSHSYAPQRVAAALLLLEIILYGFPIGA